MKPLRGVALLLAALVVSGCGQQRPEPTADRAEDIPVSDLALMVLPKEELGEVASGLRLSDEDSGPSSNAKAAVVSFDPKDTATTMKNAGRVAGFDLVYFDSRLLLGKAKGKRGVFSVATSVDLMQDPAYAAQFLHDQMTQFDRFAGKPLATGARVTRVAEFDASTVGEEARGVTFTVAFGGKKFRSATLAFRRGRLLGSVSIARADEPAPADEALDLAAKLDKRIQDALAGAIDEDSAALPPAKLRPLNLKALTLASDDLPFGPAVRAQGMQRFGDLRAFIREFEPSEVLLSGSKVLYVRVMTEEYESPRSVEIAVQFAAQSKGMRQLAEIFARASGLRPKSLEVRQLAPPVPGSAAAEFTFRAGKRRLTGVFLFVGDGRARGSLTVVAPAGKVDAADVLKLAPKLRDRLAAA